MSALSSMNRRVIGASRRTSGLGTSPPFTISTSWLCDQNVLRNCAVVLNVMYDSLLKGKRTAGTMSNR